MKTSSFRKDFIWGAATASTQIEGAAYEDGKGLSNWDIYPTINDVVYQNQNPNQGCDHYHHFKEDVALMAKLGLKGYRFSFAWPRIIPNGVGEINKKGLEFYDKLLDELEKYHIEPYATLFHWDLPYELLKKGGWVNEESPKWFLEYVKVVVNHFKGRIKNWIPINEPACVMEMGGTPLRVNFSVKEKLQTIHNLLLANGYAAKYIKDNGGNVGTALCSSLYAPLVDSCKEDVEAARKEMFIHHNKADFWKISMWADPIFLGKYPDEYFKVHNEFELPNITKEDMKIISTPIDFIGLNLYTGNPVRGDGKIMNHPIGNPKTIMDWDVFPKIMYWAPKFIYERYQKPFYITENGCAVTDIPSEDKKVHDSARIEYLKQHLKYLRKAYEDGVDLRGYFLWSFMDNFEWFRGYNPRFGIVYINYQTKERIEKDSFSFYQDTIKNNGSNL